ncbi:beta-galactosidase [Kineococcus xinjiangensis]|uniref:Beta-galactosidase n=1 Tax=Kineococcus xinjiangensis TaxID=512762 RepID=A0A2S6ITT1_9ACTN|nr:beta-galactosidase [Kineococcus xinjiangensis]PPK97662.1 beta-galactosidase [Kineococcus xinjiangensis]
MRHWNGPALAFGGDYNPEQWPEEVWAQDRRLMREAGVTLATVGVFSWALLEPEPDRFDAGWLDRVLDGLHGDGIGVCLATATASPPPWLSERWPEVLPVDADGRRAVFASRQTYCPSSPVYRERSLLLVERMAERYGEHPALRLWHVNNELGCHNSRCYCPVSTAAFRQWLRARYGSVEALNDAWCTRFWSQGYTSFEQVQAPAHTTTFPNPTQALDFDRFSSDALLGQYTAEKDVLRRITPDVPVTTNLMVHSGTRNMDYGRWAREQDVVSNDHYVLHRPANPTTDPRAELAFSGDWTRGLAGGQPWLLMEHSTSAVNWQPVNYAKLPGELVLDSLTHVARGSDGACFFQWRASAGGAEKWHSAMLPHGGTDTRVWREVVELGGILQRIAEVQGSLVQSDVAILLDYESWWTVEQPGNPAHTEELRYLDVALALHRRLRERQVTADVLTVSAEHDALAERLAGYRVVLVPTLHLSDDATTRALAQAAAAGTQVLVTYFSGVLDPDGRVRLGGYPGAFRDLLGVRVEEFAPLPPGTTTPLDDGTRAAVWSELGRAEPGTEVLASFTEGLAAGSPALTRRDTGTAGGAAWYLGTALDDDGYDRLLDRLLAAGRVQPVVSGAPAGVDAVRRAAADGSASWLFLLNRTDAAVRVPARGHDLVGRRDAEGALELPARGCAVVREVPAQPGGQRASARLEPE